MLAGYSIINNVSCRINVHIPVGEKSQSTVVENHAAPSLIWSQNVT